MPYYSIIVRHQDGSTTRAFEVVEGDVRTGFVDENNEPIDVVNGEDTISYLSREPLDSVDVHGFEASRPNKPPPEPVSDLNDPENALD